MWKWGAGDVIGVDHVSPTVRLPDGKLRAGQPSIAETFSILDLSSGAALKSRYLKKKIYRSPKNITINPLFAASGKNAHFDFLPQQLSRTGRSNGTPVED